jgi:hypothetical protein
LTTFSEPIPPPPPTSAAPTPSSAPAPTPSSAAPTPTSAVPTTNDPRSNGILGDNEMVFNGVGKDFYNAWKKAQEISKRPQNPETAVKDAALALADNIPPEQGDKKQIEAGPLQIEAGPLQIEAGPAPSAPLTPEEELSIRPPADSMEKIAQMQEQAKEKIKSDPNKIYQLFDKEHNIYFYVDDINKNVTWAPPQGKPVVVLLTGEEKVLDRDAIQRAVDKQSIIKANNVQCILF